ncbi:hypothetical protein MRX96_001056 [Rhipicephalus microplus]
MMTPVCTGLSEIVTGTIDSLVLVQPSFPAVTQLKKGRREIEKGKDSVVTIRGSKLPGARRHPTASTPRVYRDRHTKPDPLAATRPTPQSVLIHPQQSLPTRTSRILSVRFLATHVNDPYSPQATVGSFWSKLGARRHLRAASEALTL